MKRIDSISYEQRNCGRLRVVFTEDVPGLIPSVMVEQRREFSATINPGNLDAIIALIREGTQ